MLKLKNVGRKHWIDSFSWGMGEVMHSVLLDVTKDAFTFVAYLGIFIDEVMKINNI